MKNNSKAVLTGIIRACLLDLAEKKQKPVLIVDEASILRLDVFTELHTITQFEGTQDPSCRSSLPARTTLSTTSCTARQSRWHRAWWRGDTWRRWIRVR